MSADFPAEASRVAVEEWFNEYDEGFEKNLTIHGYHGIVYIGLGTSAVIGHYIRREWSDFDASDFMRARRGASAAYLASVEIDRPFRGSGRGSALMQYTIATLDARRVAYTYLIPIATSYDGPANDGLRAWYARFGFTGIAGTRFMVRVRPGVRVRRQVGRIR